MGMNYYLIFLLLMATVSSALSAPNQGVITGRVIDKETGEPLPGVNVVVEGTQFGAATDLEGFYRIEYLPAGSYRIMASMIGYSKVRITDVKVEPKKVTTINFSLGIEVIKGQEVVVSARALRNTEAALLKSRQKSEAVSDAISAEAISRAGAGTAADAMNNVTGAAVVDGKYVYIRGLGDRYTSTLLNGAEIPNANPYKHAGSLDIIPSSLIDNIVTSKSFTPDKPGSFAGGTVNINTKDFPEHFKVSFSATSAYNSKTSLKSGSALGYAGGKKDWLAMDDGTRSIPSLVRSSKNAIPDIGSAGTDYELAKKLDAVTRSFTPVMTPTTITPPVNQSYVFSVGSQFNLLGRPLGLLSSLTYSNAYSSYTNGVYARYDLGTQATTTSALQTDALLTDAKTTNDVLWATMLKTSYKLSQNHILTFNGLYNRNGESTARSLQGKYTYDLDKRKTFLTSALEYSERALGSLQLTGEHYLPFLAGARLHWKASTIEARENEPDLRFFTANYGQKNGKIQYGIKPNTPPTRYFRDMDENNREFSLNLNLPLDRWTGKKGFFKTGGFVAHKVRHFGERLFVYHQSPRFNYDGNIEHLFADSNVGLVDSTVRVINGTTYKRYNFGLVISETITPASNYTGQSDVSAFYAMFDLLLSRKLRLITGARYETTNISVVTEDETKDKGQMRTYDLLPSVNIVYTLTPNMNLRFAYGRTLARPNFREIAPYASFDFVGGDVYIGNPHLKRTLIDNFDLRWEWYSRPGEIYAVSVFSKAFQNPIETVILDANREIMWQNVDEARVRGLEFEIRKGLDVVAPALQNFIVGGNLSLVDSRVDIGPKELLLIHATRPDAPASRPFQGQSPYLLNLNLTYDNHQHGFVASLYYNVFGSRLSKVSLGGTPDVFEQPAHMLNLTVTKKIVKRVDFKFSAKNMLDTEYKKSVTFKKREYVYSLYKLGRTFSAGLEYKL